VKLARAAYRTPASFVSYCRRQNRHSIHYVAKQDLIRDYIYAKVFTRIAAIFMFISVLSCPHSRIIIMSTHMTEAHASRWLVEFSRKIFRGRLLTGVAVATAYGLSRMESTLRGVLFPRNLTAHLTVGSSRERSIRCPAIGDEKSTEVTVGHPS